jgi:sugar phosphate isomerase/epimerase
MRTLGLGHFTFLDLRPVELVRLARRTGYSFVGLRFNPFAPGQLHYCPQNAAEVRELRRSMEDEDISVYDIETIVLDQTFDPDALQPVIDAAVAVGAERLNICADDWDRAALIDRFARLCELAAASGLGVDIECMAWRGIDTPGKCVEVIKASGARNAGFLVDALHLHRCGGTAAEVRAMEPGMVVSAQLCDAPTTHPTDVVGSIAEARGGRLIPGEGGLDLTGLLAALPDQTAVSVELPMADDPRPPEARAAAIFRATMSLLETLR